VIPLAIPGGSGLEQTFLKCSVQQVVEKSLRYVILSEAKDLLYSFSVRYSRCFASLSMTVVFFNNL
jgi:hypothetical protein